MLDPKPYAVPYNRMQHYRSEEIIFSKLKITSTYLTLRLKSLKSYFMANQRFFSCPVSANVMNVFFFSIESLCVIIGEAQKKMNSFRTVWPPVQHDPHFPES